ncbi:MAG: YdcF family protein [Alphaproteobacteria bacterium]|nr:YdcF family protein [Alphaproteobacteria bacterium]
MLVFKRNKGRKRLLITVIAGLSFAWLTGLLLFIDSIPQTPENPTQKTDAIVVLTGGSLRLEEGLDLLQKGLAEKLFISGVHTGVDVKELLRLSRQRPLTLDCCITLGYEADNTQGNALETANWLRNNGFSSIRLVTGSYHMPRSLQELEYISPNIEIIQHPVFPEHVKLDSWYRWPGTSMLIIGEYNKSLYIYFRRLLSYIITANE